MSDCSFDNPFYNNYYFKDFDKNRHKATFTTKLRFLFCPTYVSCSEGYAWFHKVNCYGEILLLKYEKLEV